MLAIEVHLCHLLKLKLESSVSSTNRTSTAYNSSGVTVVTFPDTVSEIIAGKTIVLQKSRNHKFMVAHTTGQTIQNIIRVT